MTARPASLGAADLAQMIDISAVQAFHTEEDVRALADLATAQGFIAAHALPNFVPLLRSLVPAGGRTLVGGPIGFPAGGHMTAIKVAEAKALREAGADELDLMMNVGRLKSGDMSYVRDEVAAVIEAAAPVPIKVRPFLMPLLVAGGWFSPILRETAKMRHIWKTPLQLQDERLDDILGKEFATPFETAVKATAMPFFESARQDANGKLATA